MSEGLTPEVVARLGELRGWTIEALVRLGVSHDGDRVVIPILDETGGQLGVERYQPDPELRNGQPKLLASAGVSRELFPPVASIGDEEADGLLLLLEGAPDTIRAWSLGLRAVGVPGTQGWKQEWAARFAGRRWRVVVIFDCDDGGRGAARRIAGDLFAQGVDVRIVDLGTDRTDGFDLTDLFADARTADDRASAAELIRDMAEKVPLFKPEPTTPAHTWFALDLVGLGAEPPEPPSIGGIFYAGKRIVLSGEFDAGKSLLLAAISADEICAGHGVVWIDDDNMGPGPMLERLRDLGLDDEQIRELFAYLRPEEPISDDAIAYVKALIRERNGRLLVIDAFNASLSLHDYDPAKTADVQNYLHRVVDPFYNEGATVVLPDHVAKRADERGRYSYGSERKQTGVDVHLGLKVIDPFGRGVTGKAKLTVHKDRPGFLKRPSPGVFVLKSDPETGACTWRIEEAHDVTGEGGFRPTRLMEKVSVYLHGGGSPVPRGTVEKDVSGKTDYVRQALDALIAEGYVSEESGPRGARLVRHVRLFREDDE